VYTGFALSYRRLVRPIIERVRNRARRAGASVPVEEDTGSLVLTK
jgi:hypothetical protein